MQYVFSNVDIGHSLLTLDIRPAVSQPGCDLDEYSVKKNVLIWWCHSWYVLMFASK